MKNIEFELDTDFWQISKMRLIAKSRPKVENGQNEFSNERFKLDQGSSLLDWAQSGQYHFEILKPRLILGWAHSSARKNPNISR